MATLSEQAPLAGLRSILVALSLVSCAGRTPAPRGSDDHPPLPPKSGSPIGLLQEQGLELRLEPVQASKLKALEGELDSVNAPLQAELDDMRQERERMRARMEERGGSRGPAGGMGGMGAPGGMGPRGGMGGGGRAARGDAPPGGSSPEKKQQMREDMQKRAAREQDLRAQMAKNYVSVLAEALCVLTPSQREGARRILRDEGYEATPETPCDAALTGHDAGSPTPAVGGER